MRFCGVFSIGKDHFFLETIIKIADINRDTICILPAIFF